MKDFTMSMFAKKEDLYKAKAEYFEEENEKLLAKIAELELKLASAILSKDEPVDAERLGV